MRHRGCVAVVMFIGLVATSVCAQELRPLSSGTCIASVFFNRSLGPNGLIVALWSDGEFVYSKDRFEGGPPYYRGKVDEKVVRGFIDRLEWQGVFTETLPKVGYWIPDYSSTRLYVSSGMKSREFASYHEVAEGDLSGVASSAGVTSADSEKWINALKGSTKDYLLFRLIWSEIRHELDLLRPEEENLIQGEIVPHRDDWYWNPAIE